METLTYNEQLMEISKKLNQSKKESVMNNQDKVVETVVETVNEMVNTGKQAVSNPRLIGEKLAKTVNGMYDKKDQVKDVIKLGFALMVEGAKDVKRGYTETRYQKPVEEKPVIKTSI